MAIVTITNLNMYNILLIHNVLFHTILILYFILYLYTNVVASLRATYTLPPLNTLYRQSSEAFQISFPRKRERGGGRIEKQRIAAERGPQICFNKSSNTSDVSFFTAKNAI